MPGIVGRVQRPTEITVDYLDALMQPRREKFKGENARTILHEYDHVNGICFTDKVVNADAKQVKIALSKMKEFARMRESQQSQSQQSQQNPEIIVVDSLGGLPAGKINSFPHSAPPSNTTQHGKE